MRNNIKLWVSLFCFCLFIQGSAFSLSSQDEYIKVDISYGDAAININHQYIIPRIINISGYRVIFEKDHPNGLYDFNGNSDILEMNIQGETVIIRDPLHFPQTNVTIHAKFLKFEDRAEGEKSYINTKPLDIMERPEIATDGNDGIKAGDITTFLDCPVSSDTIALRFLLKGGNGQPAGLGEDGVDVISEGHKQVIGWDPDCNHWACSVPSSQSIFIGAPHCKTGNTDNGKTLIKIPINSHIFVMGWKTLESIKTKLKSITLSEGIYATPAGKPGEGGNGGNFYSNLESTFSFIASGGYPGERGFDNDDSPEIYEGGDLLYEINEVEYECTVGNVMGTTYYYCTIHEIILDTYYIIFREGPDATAPSPLFSSGNEGQYFVLGNNLSWLHPNILKRTLECAYEAPPGDDQLYLKLLLEEYLDSLEIYKETEEWGELSPDIREEFLIVEGEIRNFIQELNHPSAMIADITMYGDIWGALNKGIPPLFDIFRRAWLGFHFFPEQGWYPLHGDMNGTGYHDLIQITPYRDAWVSLRRPFDFMPPERWGWIGFRYDERDGYYGWLPLTGDVNNDGLSDLIQVTEYGDAWVALSAGSQFEAPNRWAWLGYRFHRAASGENGAIPLTGDVNGDGLCDLVQITEYTDAWVAISTGLQFEAPTRWGWLGFKYAPFDGWYPLCGDVNADGKDDLVQITPTGDPWVALSNGSSFDAPTRWCWLSSYYDEEQGHYPMLGDVNSDGMEDLIQITPSGEVWVALSLGDSFDTPEYWGAPGFLFSRENGYLPFFLDF